ncbi:hypothetical protein IAD21_02413 [Abditibacteriota bacterium]|nr:hypothetical protein IAD21_02413 [Abditibacteriota bacterium]
MAIVKDVPRAVIYTRVSTEHQSDNTSLAGQFAICAKRAQEEGALVVGAFEEVKSGGLYALRDQLQKALALIEKGEAQMLILAKLDRAGRDVDDLRDVRRRVEAAGGRLVFADGMKFEQGAIGNFLFTTLSAVAEVEKAMIVERMGAGQERLAKSGKNPNPTPPYGYYIWKKSDVIRGLCTPEQRGTYILNEEEAQWVRPIFEQLAQGVSTRGVATWLQHKGVPTRSGNPWHQSTIAQMVQNEVYIGRGIWRRNQRLIDESRAERGIGIHYDVRRPVEQQFVFEAPPLIDEGLFQQANEVVKAGRAERSGRNDAKYMLTGLLACPLCGRRVSTVPYSRNRIDTIMRTHFYRCQGSVKHNGEASRKCELPSVTGLGLENLVTVAMTEMLQSPAILQGAVAKFHASQKAKSNQSGDDARLRVIEREIETCRQREEVAATKEVEAIVNGQEGSVFANVRQQNARKRGDLNAERESILTRRAISHIETPAIEPDIATLLVNALHDENILPIEKNALLRPFVRVIYPRVVPPELRVSARAWRARGCPEPIVGDGRGHPFARNLGGCDIILRFGKGVVFILSRHLVAWESRRDKGYRKGLMPVWETSLRVEEESPFPLHWKLPSHVTTRGLGV